MDLEQLALAQSVEAQLSSGSSMGESAELVERPVLAEARLEQPTQQSARLAASIGGPRGGRRCGTRRALKMVLGGRA